MLSHGERVKLREIEKTLIDDPEFVRPFRTDMVRSPARRSRLYAEFAAWAVLFAAVLFIIGANGFAVVMAVGAGAFALASHVEKSAPSVPTDTTS